MSMISALCDELRELAIRANELHEYEMERGLDQAADLILELRDGLQQANAENAKLRESLEFANNEWEKDSLEYLNLQAENAKLRELVRLMVRRHTLTRTCMDIPCGECPAKDECDQEDALMRELGVEE